LKLVASENVLGVRLKTSSLQSKRLQPNLRDTVKFIELALIMVLLSGCATGGGVRSGSGVSSDGAKQTSRSQASPLTGAVGFYRKFISGADGNRCPMYPSCSTYSLEAIQKHGAFLGWIMTCDRLMRCGRDELTLARRVQIQGQTYALDPVAKNDFWLDGPRRRINTDGHGFW
jgi:putative component of membrane protein insertase Oxa1/YidC/SpoIIIJ protein YidD